MSPAAAKTEIWLTQHWVHQKWATLVPEVGDVLLSGMVTQRGRFLPGWVSKIHIYMFSYIHMYILKCIWETDYSISKLITFLESSSAQFALPGFSVSLSLPSLYHSLTYWERIEIIFLTGFSKNIYMMQGASTRILQPVIQVYQSGQWK